LKDGDPFDMLGFGLIAYKKTIWNLFELFFVLSFVVSPLLKTFNEGTGIDRSIKGWSHLSLGNMGYSSVQCASSPFFMENFVLTCPYGKISKIVDNGNALGINDPSVTDNSICRVSANYKNEECSKLVDSAKFKQDFEKKCKGK